MHRELEKLVSTIHQNNFKRALEDKWAYLCYAGLWHEPLRSDLDAYMESANEHVTGELTVRLYKGSAMVVGRSSPYALYDRALAGFGESGASSARTRAPASSSCSRFRASRTGFAVAAPGRVDPMAKLYEMIGRFVVGLIWMRFSRELKVAGIIFGALAAGGST